eukprot:Tamp_18405.p1 GENE.Tamp_18405~~Tamp_18405.p1  ORF type:complete len:301 (-),score=61.41 Tamp_18405:424-1245(-)
MTAGASSRPLSARTKRTTRTRATKPSANAGTGSLAGGERQANRDDQSCRDDGGDVLVDALAQFMRPASQSTIRTRPSKGSGLGSQAARGQQEGGLTRKQLAALESISEQVEAAGPNVIDEAQLRRHGSSSAMELGAPGRTGRPGGASSAMPYLPVEGLGGSISAPGGVDRGDVGGARPGPISKMPRVKEIRPHVNMTKAAMRRRKAFDDQDEDHSFRPLHPIVISRRFNRVKDDLQRTLKIPPTMDTAALRRFRSGNHAVPARELGVLPQPVA